MNFYDLLKNPLQGLGQVSNNSLEMLTNAQRLPQPLQSGIDIKSMLQNKADNIKALGLASSNEAELLDRLKPMPYPPSNSGMSGGLGEMSNKEYQTLVDAANQQLKELENQRMPMSDAEYNQLLKISKGLLY